VASTGNPTTESAFITTPLTKIPRAFVSILITLKDPTKSKSTESTAILDTASTVNLMSRTFAKDYDIPLLRNPTNITFPQSVEESNHATQELTVSINLMDKSGRKQIKEITTRFYLSDNIPYGCLLGVKTMFMLKLSFKASSDRYVPYFDEDSLPQFTHSLSFTDTDGDKRSFLLVEHEAEVDLGKLPKEYHKYSSVFSQKNAEKLPKHRPGLDCAIELLPGAELHQGPIYPLNPRQMEEADRYISENLAKGFIRPSKSPTAYPVLFQAKKDGTLRFCVDYRKLNAVTVRDSYPLPLYNLFFDQVAGSKAFSKLDLKSAYNLIRIREGDEPKTSFRTRRGQFEYLVMPFGLTNAPSVFQRFINHVLRDFLDKFVVVYLDDILIYSKSLEEHVKHVSSVLEKLKEHSLVAKLEKCVFHVPEVEFLGHIVSGNGLRTDPRKIEAVKDWPVPSKVKELQSFLGFCNYYRRFIKGFAIIAAPLHSLLSKGKRFIWNKEHQEAFNRLKILLTSAPILALPNPNEKYYLETDASHFALGCVLSQKGDDGVLHPISYYSRSFSKAERNYSITDKELLAIVAGLENWKYLLVGTRYPIEILTDHRNLLFATQPQKLSMRQARWQEVLSYYDYRVKYRPGSQNVKADALSRRPDFLLEEDSDLECILDPSKCSFVCFLDISDTNPLLNDIRKFLKEDELSSKLIQAVESKTYDKTLVKIFDLSKFRVKDGILLYNDLIWIPKILRSNVLQLHHDYAAAGHLGITKTCELINRNFFWPHWREDVRKYINSCPVCSSMKASKHRPYGKLIPLPIPDCPWQVIEIDFITNVYSSFYQKEFSIMVACDRLTKMVHLSAIEGTPTTTDAALAFLRSVFYLHGLPNEIITDRGAQFTSTLWNEITRLLSVKHTLATTGHHTTVGQVERLNQSIEQFLRCFIRAFPNEDWLDWLYLAEFIYNNSKNASTGQPPFLAFNGFLPNFSPASSSISSLLGTIDHLPDFNTNVLKIRHVLAASQELYSSYANKRRSSAPSFKINDLVWLRRPSNFIPSGQIKLCPRKYGPFRITEVLEFNNYRLDISNSPFPKRFDVFNTCELEPFHSRPQDLSLSPSISSILDCRINPHNQQCEYLVSYSDPNIPNTWISSSLIEENDSFAELLSSFNSSHSNQPVL